MMSVGWFDDLAAGTAAVDATIPPDEWTALSSANKQIYLIAAYNRIRMTPAFTIPTSPTTDQLERLQYAQAETAAYLAVHKADENVRKGLQAQGVTSAGVISESYEIKDNRAPLPHAAMDALSGMRNVGFGFAVITRDDSEYDEV